MTGSLALTNNKKICSYVASNYRLGLRHHFAAAVQFQNQDQFWISHQTWRVIFLKNLKMSLAGFGIFNDFGDKMMIL